MSVEEGEWSVWPAPAKLNLFLQITGRRADGYHTLQTVFRLLDWGDSIRIRVRDDGLIRRHGPRMEGIGESEDLAIKAAKILQSATNVGKGADIIVDKVIPVGGGFGGGSSNAATVLLVLNRLWQVDWSLDRLAQLGLQLGADVPVFIHGDNAWAEGIGEQLAPVTLAPCWYVLADSGVHASSRELFQAPELTRDSPPATIADFVSGALLDNAFEPVLRRLEPAVEAAFQALARIGRARLTGSGSGCFVEFDDRESAQAGLAALPRTLHAWIAAGASRSSLHRALDIQKS